MTVGGARGAAPQAGAEIAQLVELLVHFAAVAAQAQVQLQADRAPKPERFIALQRHQLGGLPAGVLHPFHVEPRK